MHAFAPASFDLSPSPVTTAASKRLAGLMTLENLNIVAVASSILAGISFVAINFPF